LQPSSLKIPTAVGMHRYGADPLMATTSTGKVIQLRAPMLL